MALKRRLVVDPIACKAHGVCAELFPEWLRLDDWGYPVIDPRPVPANLQVHAERAVAECPRSALQLRAPSERGARQPPAPPPTARTMVE